MLMQWQSDLVLAAAQMQASRMTLVLPSNLTASSTGRVPAATLAPSLAPDLACCTQTSAIFFCLCFILTSFVVLNLIIPVVLEQFELRDSHKRELQRREVLSALAHKQVRLCLPRMMQLHDVQRCRHNALW